MLELLHFSFLTPTAMEAIVIPLILVIFWSSRGMSHRFNQLLLCAFVVTTAESVLLSRWWESDTELSLHIYPACALLLVLLPRAQRPSWQLGYCLIFFSQLTTDILCALRYSVEQNCLSESFFCGVGGAGFSDALFLVPAFAALCLWAFEFVEAKGVAQRQLFRSFLPPKATAL
jgi:hypothetical protein